MINQKKVITSPKKYARTICWYSQGDRQFG